MWRFDNLKDWSRYPALKAYIQEKNLNFIVSNGQCLNRRPADLPLGLLDQWLDEFADCSVSMINWHDKKPCPPFLGANEDQATRTARVWFLIDLTQEAADGRASLFYSKILGALATQFFAGRPEIDRLWFPFVLENTAARGGALEKMSKGTAVIRR